MKIKGYLVLIITAILFTCIGAAFGYFTANTNGTGKTVVSLSTTNGTKFKFIPGDEIKNKATNMDNLKKDVDNLTKYYVLAKVTTNLYVKTN